MLDCLPLEIVYQILAHIPYSDFPILHEALPKHLVEVALLGKLKLQQHLQQEESLLKLVSTNRNEMVAPFYKPRLHPGIPQCSPTPSIYHYTHHAKDSLERSNESSIPLFFKHMDLEHRIIWLAPDIESTQYYFEVKDFYVSHGKLILRQQRHQALQRQGRGRPQEKVLGSLWDIRNKFPSSRSGNFSGVASQGSQPTLTSSPSLPTQPTPPSSFTRTLSLPSPASSSSCSPFSLLDSPPPSMRLSPQQEPGTFTMTMETDTTNTSIITETNKQQPPDVLNNNSSISSTSHSSPSKTDLVRAVILDACCVLTLNKGAHEFGVTGSNHQVYPSSSSPPSKDITLKTTTTTTERHGFPPRPSVPWVYSDPLPVGSVQTTFPWDTSLCCGYFVVEQVAMNISDFLDFL